MANGDESLESRLYEYCKRVGLRVDAGEYADIDELSEELTSTADELGPVIERGIAQKSLTYKWKDGQRLFSLTTDSYLAAKADAAHQADAALSEWFDGERADKLKGKPGTKKRGKPSKEKGARLTWRYAPVPLAIVDDRELSGIAVKVAAVVARSVNLGVWNTDLHAKLTYAELAEMAGVSRATAARALDELKGAGHIHVESLTRGGCRITFQQSHP